MNTDIKKFFKPITFIAVGLFNFIFLALNALSGTARYGSISYSSGICSGYKILGIETEGTTAGFLLTFAGICSILTIIVSIVLLAIGTLKLLNALNVDVNVPALDKIQAVIEKCEAYSWITNLSVQVASFVFLLIYGFSNSQKYLSIYPAVGAYLLLIFAIVAFVLVKYVFKTDDESALEVKYVCSQCGKKAKAGSNFCDDCGGAVEKIVKVPTVYVCSQCGAKASASNNFCTKCGGAIVEKQEVVEKQEEIENREDAE